MSLEEEIVTLKMRLDRSEATVQQLAEEASEEDVRPLDEPLSPQQLRAWLKARGLTGELPPMAYAHAERWRNLPEEEKQAIREELDHLPAGPMVSDIVIDNRR